MIVSEEIVKKVIAGEYHDFRPHRITRYLNTETGNYIYSMAIHNKKRVKYPETEYLTDPEIIWEAAK